MSDARLFLVCFGALHAAILAGSVAGWSRPEFRGWELVKDPDTPYFLPDRRVEVEEIGDLGYRSWVRALQHPHPGLMSTDAAGFRNPPGAAVGAPRVVLVGDSYVAGAGLRDEETLAAQLSARLGEPVYAVACETAWSPYLLLAEPRFLEHPPRAVVYAPSNRLLQPLDPGRFEPLGAAVLDRRLLVRAPPRGAWARMVAAGDAVRARFAALGRDNGLTRQAHFGLAALMFALRGHPDLIQPDGEPALALPLAEQLAFLTPAERQVDAVAATLLAFDRALRARGSRLVFAPVPDPGEVYPELFPPDQVARCARPTMLDVTLERARAAGIPAVDLRAALRAERTPYVYRRDDSHWSPRGVGIAARALDPTLRALLAE